MPMPKGLTLKAKLRWIADAMDALMTGQSEITTQLTTIQETLMTLNAKEQAIVDAVNASTNNVSDALTSISASLTQGVQAITDLFNNQSSITLADISPKLDAMNAAAAATKSAADALAAIATADDPALTPAAPPIVLTNPDGTVTPVSETPVP